MGFCEIFWLQTVCLWFVFGMKVLKATGSSLDGWALPAYPAPNFNLQQKPFWSKIVNVSQEEKLLMMCVGDGCSCGLQVV